MEDGFEWELINVYGPVQDDKKREFLQELFCKIHSVTLPCVVGGDFNMVRRVGDKSTGQVNIRWMEAFNEFIMDTSLLELQRSGERYTWSNNQVTPIFSILDRVFVNNAWEDKYPLVTAQVCTRIGSDHNPIIVDTGGRPSKMPTYFRFDPTWLTQEGFRNWVTDRWPVRLKAGSRDHWHVISGILHRAMKGWGANFGSNLRKHKQQLLLEIDAIDREANFTDLPPTTWEHRYKLERELIEIYTAEEIYWQKRGGQKWILQGDSNTAFFHKCANGRKRKTLIKSLEEEGRVISDPVELRQHIDAYYKKLFGREQMEGIHLIEDL